MRPLYVDVPGDPIDGKSMSAKIDQGQEVVRMMRYTCHVDSLAWLATNSLTDAIKFAINRKACTIIDNVTQEILRYEEGKKI